ncbi:hypothetical protein [Dickeya dadantii]|uniref:hypothetical protein n=1 Tax=Dickeya dadantii TaxID=204038 RepID=UPI000577A999|nr:hypothetical protein [Dickeya dadantii]
MKHAEKLDSAIALLLISSGIAVAEKKEVINKNTQVGNATKYCIKIDRMDKKPFSNEKTELLPAG